MHRCLVILLLTLSAAHAKAEIDGGSDPAFIKAMEMWLAGDDPSALRGFTEAASADNLAAQIFLWRLHSFPNHTILHAEPSLSREEWRRTVRRDSTDQLSMFGTFWSSVAAERSELARALRGLSGDVETSEIVWQIETLARYGEHAALQPPEW